MTNPVARTFGKNGKRWGENPVDQIESTRNPVCRRNSFKCTQVEVLKHSTIGEPLLQIDRSRPDDKLGAAKHSVFDSVESMRRTGSRIVSLLVSICSARRNGGPVLSAISCLSCYHPHSR